MKTFILGKIRFKKWYNTKGEMVYQGMSVFDSNNYIKFSRSPFPTFNCSLLLLWILFIMKEESL